VGGGGKEKETLFTQGKKREHYSNSEHKVSLFKEVYI